MPGIESAGLASLTGSGWLVAPQNNSKYHWEFDTSSSFIAPITGLYWFSGCGGGGGGGNGEAAAGGGGGGGGGAGRGGFRVPLWIHQGELVTVTIGAGGAVATSGGSTSIFLGTSPVLKLGFNQGGNGGNGAAGVGGGGGFVGGSFQGQSATAAGANSTYRTAFGGFHWASSSTGSGGGHTGLSAGIGNVLESDLGVTSSGQSGGGMGGTTQFGLDTLSIGLGGAPGVNGTAPAAGNWGAGGGGGGAAASPGAGAAGYQGVCYIEVHA